MTLKNKVDPFTIIWLFILLMALVLYFSSCRTVKKTTETIRVDTVQTVKEVTVTDTVFHLKADSSFFEALVECDSNNRAYIRKINTLANGTNIQTKYIMRNDTIRVESRVDADSIVAYWKNYYLSKTDKSKFVKTETVKKTGGFSLKWLINGIIIGIVFWWSKKYWWPFIKKIVIGV